jgi:hypothetical protein
MDDAETVAIENTIAALSADYPGVPPSRVAELVHAEHARFTGRPIRDFVPVLVESRVREQLRSTLRRAG